MALITHFVKNELDAGDTDLAKRLSAFNFCNPFDHVLPFADGTISAADRAHLWGLYSGIAVAAASAVGEWEMIPPWKKHRRIATHRI